MHAVAGEARTIERRLAHSDWVVGETFSAADMVIYPGHPAVAAGAAAAAGARTGGALPADGSQLSGDRALAERVAALPGHERTWPPHWREPEAAAAGGVQLSAGAAR